MRSLKQLEFNMEYSINMAIGQSKTYLWDDLTITIKYRGLSGFSAVFTINGELVYLPMNAVSCVHLEIQDDSTPTLLVGQFKPDQPHDMNFISLDFLFFRKEVLDYE